MRYIMKILSYFFITLAIFSFVNCSSDKSKGKEIAEKFCSAMNENDNNTKIQKLLEIETLLKEYGNNSTEFNEAFFDNISCLESFKQKIEFDEKISGNLSNDLRVVPQEYYVTYEDGSLLLKVLVEKTSYTKYSKAFSVGEISILDGSKVQIYKIELYNDNGSNPLLEAEYGAKNWITEHLSLTGYFSDNRVLDYIKGIKNVLKFRYATLILNYKYEDNVSSYNSNDKTEYKDNDNDIKDIDLELDRTSENNFDELLSEFESYVDQYIKVLKKAKSGDLSAITEYPSLFEKAQSLQSSLTNSKDDMSPSQVKKLLKIQKKLIEAAQNL